MTEENLEDKEGLIYEAVVKKTKTGITFPKEMRALLFDSNEDIYFQLRVPKNRKYILLNIISEEEANQLSGQQFSLKEKKEVPEAHKDDVKKSLSDKHPNWAAYFVYDFKNKDKVQPILESAFYKFGEVPLNLEDAMGRVKYALVSFLTSIKTENAKLYYAVEKFLIDVIEQFDHPNLLDWIFEKIIPRIESKFLYELALLDLVEVSIKVARWEKAELYIFYVLKNIDDYPKSEMYNIMNSFKQLVKKVKYVERSNKIDLLLKEKLMEYGECVEDADYKIQIVEFLEDLNYIELAYSLAKKIQLSLPQDSLRLDDIRKIVKRLHSAPITENKPNSSMDFEDADSDEIDDTIEETVDDEIKDENDE
jgi:hypothetical protein